MTELPPATSAVTGAPGLTAPPDRGRDEPEWLRARRQEALDIYHATPMPTRKEEEWRYMDLRRKLDLDSVALATVAPGIAPGINAHEHTPTGWIDSGWPQALRATLLTARAASGHVVQVDGRVVHVDLDPALSANGVVLTSFGEAATEHGEFLERHLATDALPPTRGKFAALNAALWTDGVLLHVPAGVEIPLPIRVTRWVSQSGAADFSRTLIVGEAGSRVWLVEEVISDDFEEQTFVSSAAEVIGHGGAQLHYVSLQRLGRQAFFKADQRTIAGRDATVDSVNVSLGATTSRIDVNAVLEGPGSHSELLGLCFGDGDQHFDHNTSQDHVAPHAGSDLLYKGALDGKARAVFRGIIRVHEGAQRTDAYQTNRSLLLSEDARADSLPNLEIEADDVRCSHGSTVGALDEEQLFYLMGRGLTRVQAERLVVLGFLGDVLQRLPLGGVVAKVTGAIEEKLQRHA